MSLDVAYYNCRVLILRGGRRRPYLRFRRILIKMATRFFSSSWRILEPYSCATHPRREDGRPALGPQRAREPRKNKTSRWNAGKDLSFVPLRPERVVEVRYDHMEGERFRSPPSSTAGVPTATHAHAPMRNLNTRSSSALATSFLASAQQMPNEEPAHGACRTPLLDRAGPSWRRRTHSYCVRRHTQVCNGNG